VATIGSEGAVSLVVVQVATPLPLTGAGLVQSGSEIATPPLAKVTVPGGTLLEELAVTVAVNITESFTFDGFFDDTNAVLLVSLFTVSEVLLSVAAPKLWSVTGVL